MKIRLRRERSRTVPVPRLNALARTLYADAERCSVAAATVEQEYSLGTERISRANALRSAADSYRAVARRINTLTGC